jgi:hypothetical protein
MAIAFDADSNVAAGTGNLSWTHTPVGTPRGVIVLIVQDEAGGATDDITSVEYGGVLMTRADAILHVNGTEDGSLYAYFLGSGIPTGAQTVLVTVSGATSKRAVAITVTAAADTAVEDTATLDSASDSAPDVDLITGAGVECFIAGAMHSGENNPANIDDGADYTTILEHDFGNASCNWCRRTSNSTGGTVNINWTNSVNEAGVVAIAVKEAGAATVTRLIQDALLLSEQARQLADRPRKILDTLLLSDAQRRTVDVARLIADALLLSDAFTAEKIFGGVFARLIQDALLLSDLFTQKSPLTAAEGFSDNFNDNSRDVAKWNENGTIWYQGTFNPAHAVAETNQQVRITLSGTEIGFNGYSSVGLYNLTGSHVRVEVVETGRRAATGADSIQTVLLLGTSTTLYAAIYVLGQIIAFERGNPFTVTTLAFDPAIHHHWRIRHDTGDDTLRFETSLDGVTWTQRKTAARTFDITAIRFEIIAGVALDVTANPGAPFFDNFNTTASQVYPRPVADRLLLEDLFTATFVSEAAVVHFRLVQDGILMADAPQQDRHLHLREPLLLSDQLRQEAARVRAILDAMLVSDQTRQQADRAASILDRLLLADQTLQQAERQARLQDALLLSDAQRRVVDTARLLAETVLVSDASVVTADRRRQILDALLLSDLFTAERISEGAAQVITRLVQDALLLTDVYRREQEMVVRVSAGLADTYLLDRHLHLREQVELLGEISKEALRLRAIADLISTMDTTAATAVRMRLIADVVPLADAVRKVQEMIVRAPISLVDSVIATLFETIIRILTGIRIALVDPLGRNHDVRFRDPLGRATGDRTQTPFVRTIGWRNQP